MAEQRSAGGRRSAAKEQAWRDIFIEHSQSGSSVVRFCRERKIATSGFYFWRNEIAKRDAERSTASPQSNETQVVKPPVDFAEVKVTKSKGGHDCDQHLASPILIHLANHCRVEVPVGFDAQSLREIIGVLRGEAC